MKKIAIIGASYLQMPLIEKAKSRGIETHVFAWAANDVGEKAADFFYPISITEKDEILKKCEEIGIDGICSIASDLATITVSYVAEKMGLVGNPIASAEVSTNKHKMRKCFEQNGDPSPLSILIHTSSDLEGKEYRYPIIVKPVDRSGSRGVTKLDNPERLNEAIEYAKEQGFEEAALVEEYVDGQEYSVECISWEGEHHFIALTKKYTTGDPAYVETAHMEPAEVEGDLLLAIQKTVYHALSSLGIVYGASHSEIKVTKEGKICLIEIGARMGGDCIGSSLVQLSTGFDFVSAVIDISLGVKPVVKTKRGMTAGIRFVFSNEDIAVLNDMKKNHPELLVEEDLHEILSETVRSSDKRFGYFILAGDRLLVENYLP